MLLGHARGKVGDLVFARQNGQQIVRARAASVRNPQTETQMIQRIILNTVAQAYSKMQPIVDHSFEGVQAGQKTMSRFMSTNISMLRAKVAAAVADNTVGLDEVRAFVPVGDNSFAPNEFVISQGSLPEIVPSVGVGTAATVNVGGVTYEAILNALGLQRGDQLTFIAITGADRNYYFEYARIILDPTNQDGSPASLASPLLVDGVINVPSPRNTGEFHTLAITEAGVLTYGVGAVMRSIYSVAIVVSRKGQDGNWMRSNARMVINDVYISDFYSMFECLQMLRDGSISALSTRYLNNSGTGNLANSNGAAATSVVAGIGSGSDAQPSGEVTIVSATTAVNSSGQRLVVLFDSEGNKHLVRNRVEGSTYALQYLTAGSVANPVASEDYEGIEGINRDTSVFYNDANDQLSRWLIANAGFTQAKLNAFIS